ncbi:MAG: 5-formyltetrahydrofolate cyclo-ligase [Pseudomonadota bacterium]
MSAQETKNQYREQAKLHRERRPIDEAEFEAVVDIFFDYFKPEKDQVISGYWPNGNEFDIRFLLDEIVNRELTCALPVLEKDRVLTFRQWSHDAKMKDNQFGVLEPQETEELIPDIVLAPLLAHDQKGYRLGYGGGYYDATIAKLREEREIKYIGIGYADQAVLFTLPNEEHDVPLDFYLSPQGVKEF